MSAEGDSKRLASLDLLRAFAICSVFVAHSVLAYAPTSPLGPLQVGGTGVDLFFVLSGWLLGRQLFRELDATSGLNIPRFLVRRWLRTLPCYIVMLVLTWSQIWLSGHSLSSAWAYLTFTQNYLSGLPYLFVTWSLCVEEHFYLLVGPLLLLIWHVGRLAAPLAIGLLLLPALGRLFGAFETGLETHIRYDACAVGVLLAGVSVRRPRMWQTLCRLAPILAAVGVIGYGLLVLSRTHFGAGWRYDETSACVAIFGSILLFAVSSEKMKQVLYVPGCGLIAKRAYCIYLIHPEALAVAGKMHLGSFALFIGASAVVTAAAAELLHRFVEVPFMRARDLPWATRLIPQLGRRIG